MSDHPVISPKKLIEVALPLDAINAACAKEKSIRHGHPSTLHLWWARRPLAAARSVIFSQLVNDPAGLWEAQNPGQKPSPQQRSAFTKRRRELFDLIKELVLWENTTNEAVLDRARGEIRRSWKEVCELNKVHPQAAELFNPDKLPGLHDPFAGGGAIPLEAQRLGLEAYASDLNPVAVLINKAMIEIPPKFAGKPPVNPAAVQRGERSATWKGATGLAEDVRYYGAWMRGEAQKRIGHLYPPVEITPELAGDRPDLKALIGQKLTVIAWLWARTVKSPSPAFSHVDVPLASTFILSSKAGKEAYVQPVVEGDNYHFTVKLGSPPSSAINGSKLSRGSFGCVMSGTPIGYAYIDDEANAKRSGSRLMAIVAEGIRGRVYLPPTSEAEMVATSAKPGWGPETPCRGTFASNAQGRSYGFKVFSDYFTSRQLVALTTFSELIGAAGERILSDASRCMNDDSKGIDQGGDGAKAYSEAVCVYLALCIDRLADSGSSLVSWTHQRETLRTTFARQAIAMPWDFAETNPVEATAGSFDGALEWAAKALLFTPAAYGGTATQSDAQSQQISTWKVVSTDPPYYNNICYSDLSDFFYVWLRVALRSIYPGLLATISVPKAEELVASQYRHGSKEKAESFFLAGMTMAMEKIAILAHPEMPITIYYAVKETETNEADGTISSGWETFLEAVHRASLQLTGTWPMRTEREGRAVGIDANSLASSIILVCRKRPANAPSVSRREFLRELNTVLPLALDEMTKGAGDDQSPVAPVDLSQAIIGPGMAVFSKYSAVLEADGSSMNVKTALQLINRFLADDDFDPDTHFCLQWFDQFGWQSGDFGMANTLAQSQGSSVEGIADAGVIESGSGKVRLLKWAEYPSDWDPRTDTRNPVWETLHHLIRALRQDGESAAGQLLGLTRHQSEGVRQLSYRLYTLCERKGWAEDARAYNELITSWESVDAASSQVASNQAELF
ncbi:MAG: DUF1156 domain-containing protein [Verrucomicrobiota bacterium]